MTLSRLLRNGLTFSKLISHFESSRGVFEFYDKLKDIGIERKAAKSIADFLVRDHKPTGAVEEEARTEVGQSSQDAEDEALKETAEYGIYSGILFVDFFLNNFSF